MNCYILVFRHADLARQAMLDYLDTVREVKNWRAEIGAIFIASDSDQMKLTERVREKFPDLQFVVAKIDGVTSQGWASKETWDFINDPKPS